MMLPDAVTIGCKRCGEDIVIPIAIEGPFTDEQGVHCDVFADVRNVEHRCSVRRPPNKPSTGKPR